MRRAFHIGLFLGILIGASACGHVEGGANPGVYGGVDATVPR